MRKLKKAEYCMLRTLFFLSGLGIFLTANCQLCTGSLGDPVVNITFGNGGNANTGYTPTSAYTYTSSSCPDDGFYTITKSTSGCFGSSWHTVNADHTGNGAFLLVNASYQPGDFFLSTVTDLCPNTTYEFAAWMMNVLSKSGIKPNITFRIETPAGIVLQEYSTGDIFETPVPQWKQYGFFFATPVNNPIIVLRITNNAPGGNGNDIALDDITFRPCGPEINSAIRGYTNRVDICEGNANLYTFDGVASASYLSPVYQWQESIDTGKTWMDIPGANTLSFLRQPTSTAGAYWYRMLVTELTSAGIRSCRIASNNLIINVHAKPLVDAGADRIVLAGDTIHLAATVKGENPRYYWDPPDHLSNDSILGPVADPSANMTYQLYAESEFGCKNQDNLFIKVVAGIFVPSAFTPNNDGLNDHWHIPFLDPQLGATVMVYNRYGQLVYRIREGWADWDGNVNGIPQPSGIYVYLIRFKKGRPAMKGTVTIMR